MRKFGDLDVCSNIADMNNQFSGGNAVVSDSVGRGPMWQILARVRVDVDAEAKRRLMPPLKSAAAMAKCLVPADMTSGCMPTVLRWKLSTTRSARDKMETPTKLSKADIRTPPWYIVS